MFALVIDDSRAMRMILRRILEPAGYEVTEADNGRTGLEALRGLASAPDLALVDWNMPEMDGLSFISAVRARAEWRDITLMMVTTESEQARVIQALAAGAHEYLIKPFTADAVYAKLDLLGLDCLRPAA